MDLSILTAIKQSDNQLFEFNDKKNRSIYI